MSRETMMETLKAMILEKGLEETLFAMQQAVTDVAGEQEDSDTADAMDRVAEMMEEAQNVAAELVS